MRVSLRRFAGALALLFAVAGGAGAHAAAVVAPGPAASAPADAACPPPPTPITSDEGKAGMRAAVDHGLLWKATKDGRSVYLYGTIHVAKRDWMFPGPQAMHAIMTSDAIALELDPLDADVVAHLQKAFLRRPDTPALPDALQRRLDAAMAVACLAPAALAVLRPEMQAVSIEVLAGRRFGLYPEYGVDEFLAGLGHGMKKPVRSLETPESQAALLVSDDPVETVRNVGDVLDEIENPRSARLLQRLAVDWERGDLADIEAYGTWCECMDTPERRADFAKLVDDRNPLMADKVAQWHAEGKSLFVAVGTLHMIGRIGLPELLKARGFQVERVAYPARP